MLKKTDMYLLALTVILALFARVAFFLLFESGYSYENMEVDGWLRIGEHLVKGEGYSWLAPNLPTAKRGPVAVYFFAAVLWLFGQQSLPIIVANWIVDIGTCVMLYFIAMEVFNDRRTALVSSLIYAVYVPAMTYTLRAWSEPLFTLLLAVFIFSLLLALRRPALWRFAIVGLLLGLTILTRPSMEFYLLVVLALIFWKWRKSWPEVAKYTGITVVSLILILMPWIIRNHLVFDHFIPASTYSGWPLFESNHSLGEPDFLRYRVHEESAKALMETLEPKIGPTLEPKKFFLHAALNGMSEYELDQIAGQQAVQAILAHPDRYLILSGVRFFRLWFNIGYGAPPSRESYLVMILNLTLLLLAALAYIFWREAWVKRTLPLVALVVLNTLIYMAVQALVRYTIPVMPYVILVAGYTLVKAMPREIFSPPVVRPTA